MEQAHRILVVEDNPADAYLVREVCKVSAGTSDIRVVGDGNAAWNALTAEQFDLVILDIGLPMENGFELLSRIRAESRLDHTAIIVFSDLYGDEPLRADAAGADCVVPKPGDLADYLEVLSKAVWNLTGAAKGRAAGPVPVP